MPYYAGDYYRGDYYQGDNYAAGGLFSGIGKLVKKVGGALLGSTPVGAAVKLVAPKLLGAGGGGTAMVQSFGPPPGMLPVPGIRGRLQRALPFGETGYYKRRRMNPLNIKALRRAMRRAKGFEKQARRVGSFFNPGKSFRLKGRGRKRA